MIVTPRSTRNASSRPSRSQARFAFSILFTINVLNYADRDVLPAILPKARQDLGLTTIEEGLLGSSFLLVYGLATLPLGAWADRGVRKNIIGLWVALWSVATCAGYIRHPFTSKRGKNDKRCHIIVCLPNLRRGKICNQHNFLVASNTRAIEKQVVTQLTTCHAGRLADNRTPVGSGRFRDHAQDSSWVLGMIFPLPLQGSGLGGTHSRGTMRGRKTRCLLS